MQDSKYLQLEGRPWTENTDSLHMSLIACLARFGYRLDLDLDMDTDTRVFFFIRDKVR